MKNPLFIYGDTGLGKTHLMQAIAHVILERNPQTRITFVGTEQFTNDLIGSIQNRTTAAFRRQYRETDMRFNAPIRAVLSATATRSLSLGIT